MAEFGLLQLSGYGVDTVKAGRPVKILLKDKNGVNEQLAEFFSKPKNSTELENSRQEINFNTDTKAHQALMEIIGDDVLDINDLDGIENKVKKYGITVKSLNKNNGTVTLGLSDGKTLTIDFWTNDELKTLHENTTSPITNFAQKTTETAQPHIESGFNWFEKNIFNPIARQIDTGIDRIEQWLRTP